jgi:hypothetical protein
MELRMTLARRARAWLFLTLAAAALALAPASQAADPGRWEAVTHTAVPLEYFQGVTAEPGGTLYFDGIYTGVFRAVPTRLPDGTWTTVETGRNENVIPADVTAAEGYEHAGDLTWAPTRPGEEPALAALVGDSGRLLLPLECWIVTRDVDRKVCPDDGSGGPRPSTGAIGVVDARTLTWQYYVKLDEGALRKAMWAELSPNGKLLWTQGGEGTQRGEPGRDLVAFPVAGIAEANAATPGEDGTMLKPKVVLRGAVPPPDPRGDGSPTQITGATFFDGRLYLAAQTELASSYVLRVWSLNVDSCEAITGCDRRLEIERELVGESEGLTAACTFGSGERRAVLHWLVAPYNDKDVPTFWKSPYFHAGRSTVMSFAPTSGAGVDRLCRH